MEVHTEVESSTVGPFRGCTEGDGGKERKRNRTRKKKKEERRSAEEKNKKSKETVGGSCGSAASSQVLPQARLGSPGAATGVDAVYAGVELA